MDKVKQLDLDLKVQKLKSEEFEARFKHITEELKTTSEELDGRKSMRPTVGGGGPRNMRKTIRGGGAKMMEAGNGHQRFFSVVDNPFERQ